MDNDGKPMQIKWSHAMPQSLAADVGKAHALGVHGPALGKRRDRPTLEPVPEAPPHHLDTSTNS